MGGCEGVCGGCEGVVGVVGVRVCSGCGVGVRVQ